MKGRSKTKPKQRECSKQINKNFYDENESFQSQETLIVGVVGGGRAFESALEGVGRGSNEIISLSCLARLFAPRTPWPNRYSGFPPPPTSGFCCAFVRRRFCKKNFLRLWDWQVLWGGGNGYANLGREIRQLSRTEG